MRPTRGPLKWTSKPDTPSPKFQLNHTTHFSPINSSDSSNKFYIRPPNANPRPPNPYGKPNPIKCYRCNQPGHKSNECPQRWQVNCVMHNDFTSDFDDSEANDNHQIDDDVEYVVEDSGIPLVGIVQKLMLTPRQTQCNQRNAIFRTKCTIEGKVCDIIVDSENIVSKTLVRLLKLHTMPHPNQYSVGWVKKNCELKVTELCKVTLSIGKHYKDDILCDTLDMDACHILWGHPWQFDKSTLHNGQDNTYTFHWHGKKIVLLPSKSPLVSFTPLPYPLPHNHHIFPSY